MSFNKSTDRIILASSSPQRQTLLSAAGYQFDIRPPDVTAEGNQLNGETAFELVARLAYQKTKNVAGQVEGAIFLGCDTVGEIDGEVLGKPKDRQHAEQMLRKMSGRVHRVVSGICLMRKSDHRINVQVAETKLKMNVLSDSWISDYLDSNQWEGKSGGFGFQDGLDWIEILEGSESNVIGLPLEMLEEMLDEF